MANVTCPSCGRSNPQSSRSCIACGSPLPTGTMLESERAWVIGSAADCDIVISQAAISRHHCRLVASADGFVLEDLRSTNGTFVNGQRISTPVRVTREDQITLGRTAVLPWPEPAPQATRPGPRPTVMEAAMTSSPTMPQTAKPSESGRIISIGREDDNDIVLDYPTVSAHHARITCAGNRATIEDLRSTNGTAVNSPVNRITASPLSPEDTVYFGSLRIPAQRLLGDAFSMGERPSSDISFAADEMVLGRDSSCDEVLDFSMISWRHARLFRKGEVIFVEDLKSTNGTFVNGHRVSGPTRVNVGDVIGLGSFTFQLTQTGSLAKRDFRGNVTIEARNVTVDVPGKRLLDNVALTIYPSEMVALMGPSGAGKTTLMLSLNGYTRPTAGAVFFNGKDLYGNYDQFRLQIGYVPQDDIMHRDLTVGQALYYTARLRLPADFSEREIQERIAKVLAQLGLEGIENVLIGSPEKKGISGGQRKRVNIAMELLTDPLVLFLDEPTSGLSSEDAAMVVSVLRKLADQGKTILLTIHQPSLEVFRMMDTLTLVAKDKGTTDPGNLVYFGPAYPDAVTFFNPSGVPNLKPGVDPSPDEVLRGFSRQPTREWVKRFTNSEIKRTFVDERAGTRPSGADEAATMQSVPKKFGLAQWWTLTQRSMLVKVKDIWNTAVLMSQAPLIAGLMVLCYRDLVIGEPTAENWGNIARFLGSTLFVLSVSAIWFGCSNAARDIVAEWAIYRRERMVNLKIPSFVFSKLTVLCILAIIQCIIMLTIVNLGVKMKGPFLAQLAVLTLASFVGTALGLLLSAISKTTDVAVSLVPLMLIPVMILGGAMLPIHMMTTTVKNMSHSIGARWAFEYLAVSEATKRPQLKVALPPVPRNVKQEAPKAQDMAEMYFPEDKRVGVKKCVGVLIGMFTVYIVLTLIILRRRDIH